MLKFNQEELLMARELENQPSPFGCSENFLEVVRLLFNDSLPSPKNVEESYQLFVQMMEMIHDADT